MARHFINPALDRVEYHSNVASSSDCRVQIELRLGVTIAVFFAIAIANIFLLLHIAKLFFVLCAIRAHQVSHAIPPHTDATDATEVLDFFVAFA